MTHRVKQSSFAGVRQCYSYVRHTHTHTQKHTKSIFFPPILLHLPKVQLGCQLNCCPHYIMRVTRRSKKHTAAFDCQQKLLSSYLPLQGTDPPNQPSTNFFFLLYATRTNLQCETLRNASCLSTYCTCIIPCVNQTGQDLTCSFLKASA